MCDGRTVVQPLRYVVDHPVQALEEIHSIHGAAAPYPPMVRTNGWEVERFEDGGFGHGPWDVGLIGEDKE